MTTLSLPMVAHEGGLSKYFTEIWKIPLLGRDEEYMLAERWRHHGDVDAAHRLVTSHLRLVAKIAMKYRRYGLPIADMISEGNIGLMKAVRKFEPERGFRLSTYAMWWIRASITEYILASWSLVKMGTVAAQKKMFFSLRRVKARLEIFDNGELDGQQVAQISQAMNIREADVVNMNRRMSARDYSLNAPVSDGEGALEFQDTLVDDRPSPEEVLADGEEQQLRHNYLQKAIATLPERERRIFVERRLSEDVKTLEVLGELFNISRERVRQLEVRAFEKVQKAIKRAMDDEAREENGAVATA
jgi:RNA polymerase sigma-32 factor